MQSRTLSLSAILCLLAAASGWSQDTRGTIVGKISDPSGAVIPGAEVVVTNLATGTKVALTTNAGGMYLAPLLPPGTYQETVRFRGQQSSQPVRVIADPRAPHSAEEWQRRWQAIERAGADSDRAVAAVKRIRQTRADVDAIGERVRQANEKAIRKGTVQADELPLVKAGKELLKGLDELEKRLWSSPETVGIVRDETVLSHLAEAGDNLGSSWDPPNPTHLALLEKAEGELAVFSKDLEAFYADRVAAYRRQVAEAKVALLPEVEPTTAREK